MSEQEGTEFQIEPIREEHIESFHRCLDAIARERKHLAFIEAPPLESARTFVLDNISRDIPQFVALQESEVIGFCDIRPKQLPGFEHTGTLGMGVLEQYRRKGIGKKLLKKTISKARTQGMERIELEVYASNVPAIRLYEKIGFEVEGVKRRARILDGHVDDLVIMALLF